MSATQDGSQVPEPSRESGGNRHEVRIRKLETMTLLSVGGVVGCLAAIGRRTLDHASYWGAISTGVVVAAALVGFVAKIVMYIRKES